MQRDVISADILNNLVVNYEAGAGSAGIQVANYFVSKGVDAHMEPQSGDEFWLVVFNPKILKNVVVVDPKSVSSEFPFMLPTIHKL
jgi:malic enzyme